MSTQDGRPLSSDIEVEFWPRGSTERPGAVRLVLMDTRAADDIRISYDFERDGWSIQQASRFEWDADDSECDPDWREVAFVKAWARGQ